MNNFEEIKNLYSKSYQKYGDSPASLLTPKGRSELRFKAIDPFINFEGVKILDYGCGLGFLLEYLSKFDLSFDYTGYDILQDFIDACKAKYDCGNFKLINENSTFNETFDIVFSSGVFNIASHDCEKASKSYAFERIEKLFSLTKKVFICDFPSEFVDFKQPNSQHFKVKETIDFIVKNLSRRFQLRHDILPYEMTVIVYKDDCIKRPESAFSVDL